MVRHLFRTPHSFALTITRLALGVVFFAHGAQKVFGWWGGSGYSATFTGFTHRGVPAPFAFLAIMAEFLGGIGLIVGLLGRIAAFGIACNMLVAIVTVHAVNGFFMNWAGKQKGEGIEYHLLALGLAFAVMIGGSGAVSADEAIYLGLEHPTAAVRNRAERA